MRKFYTFLSLALATGIAWSLLGSIATRQGSPDWIVASLTALGSALTVFAEGLLILKEETK